MNIKFQIKKQLVKLAMRTLAGTGLFLFIFGIFSCFVGLTGTTIVKKEDMLNLYSPILRLAIYLGGVGIGSGLLAVGLEIGTRHEIRDRLEVPELNIANKSDNLSRTECINCKNYHGRSYEGMLFVCAIHPYGPQGKCPDWLARTKK